MEIKLSVHHLSLLSSVISNWSLSCICKDFKRILKIFFNCLYHILISGKLKWFLSDEFTKIKWLRTQILTQKFQMLHTYFWDIWKSLPWGKIVYACSSPIGFYLVNFLKMRLFWTVVSIMPNEASQRTFYIVKII